MQTLKEQLIKVKDKSKGKQLLQNNNFLELYRKSNMAARVNNVFWLVETLKIFLSETTQPMEL
jgi:hypothetical protein